MWPHGQAANGADCLDWVCVSDCIWQNKVTVDGGGRGQGG